MAEKTSPEADAIVAYGTATMATLRILVLALETNGSLEPGQMVELLRKYMEASKDFADDMTLAIMDDLRRALMN
jgi:hypothetical protein